MDQARPLHGSEQLVQLQDLFLLQEGIELSPRLQLVQLLLQLLVIGFQLVHFLLLLLDLHVF